MPVLKQIGAVVDRRKSVRKRRRRRWKRRKRRMWKGGGDDTYQEEKKGGGNTKKRSRISTCVSNGLVFSCSCHWLAGGENETATGGRGEDGRRQWSWLARDAAAATVFWRRKRGQRRGKRGTEVADGGRGGRGRGQRRRATAAAGKEERKMTTMAAVDGKATGSRGDWRRGQRLWPTVGSDGRPRGLCAGGATTEEGVSAAVVEEERATVMCGCYGRRPEQQGRVGGLRQRVEAAVAREATTEAALEEKGDGDRRQE
ncbi:hypothetical protein B296_00022785 [Ensete ventricosum]|uniref:Uncharacterized protein n=1 Tax=Ensete ventricosum TaxID=4639 RepID=A0A426YUV9_ENSVE|nr:hypothetical protein B296_00022785 [Ensete ventricosum]